MRPAPTVLPHLLVVLLLLVGSPANAVEPKVRFSKIERQITVLPEGKGMTTREFGRGVIQGAAADIAIAYNEKYKLRSFNVEYMEDRKGKVKLAMKDSRDRSLVSGVFYSDNRIRLMNVPPTQSFMMTTELVGSDPMFLSSVPLRWNEPVDTLVTTIEVPQGMRLFHDRPLIIGIQVSIDSVVSTSGIAYTFMAIDTNRVISRTEPNDRHLKACDRSGYVRIILTHGKFVDDPDRHFNQWMMDLAAPVQGLTGSALQLGSAIETSATGTKERMQAAFAAVQQKVHYVAVEDGFNAFRPRAAQATCDAGKGDCKDMANLTCNLLRHFGVESYLAVSSTMGHGTDMDFPSLRSGDHMICVARYENDWIFLDATDATCLFGRPSRHIQGRQVLALTPDGPLRLLVPVVPVDQNTADFELDLLIDGTRLGGRMKARFNGLSASSLIHMSVMNNNKDLERYITATFEDMGRNWKVDSISYQVAGDRVDLSALVHCNGNVTLTQNKRYISQKSFPFPHDLPTEIPEGFDLLTYEAMQRSVTVSLRASTPLHVVTMEPVSLQLDDMGFKWSMTTSADGSLTVKYDYVDRAVVHTSAHRSNFNLLNALARKTLDTSLIDEIH